MKQTVGVLEPLALDIAAIPLDIPVSPVVAELPLCVEAYNAARAAREAFEAQHANILEEQLRLTNQVEAAADRLKAVAKQVLGPGETMQKGPLTLTRVCSYSYDAAKIRQAGIAEAHPEVLKTSVDSKVLEALVKTGQVQEETIKEAKSKAVSDYVKVSSR